MHVPRRTAMRQAPASSHVCKLNVFWFSYIIIDVVTALKVRNWAT
jgi:hypothetical protein